MKKFKRYCPGKRPGPPYCCAAACGFIFYPDFRIYATNIGHPHATASASRAPPFAGNYAHIRPESRIAGDCTWIYDKN